MPRLGLRRDKSAGPSVVALLGQVIRVEGDYYTLCAYPSDDARYPNEDRKSVSTFLRNLDDRPIRGTLGRERHNTLEGDIVSFECRLGHNGGIAYDLVNLSERHPKKFPRVRSSSSVDSLQSTQSGSSLSDSRSTDFSLSMSNAVAAAVSCGPALSFVGIVRSLPFRATMGIISVESAQALAEDEHIISKVSRLIGSNIPFRFEENQYKPQVGQSVTFGYGSFASSYGRQGKTFRAINIRPAPKEHDRKPGLSRAQSRKASFTSQNRDPKPPKNHSAYYVGIVSKIEDRAVGGIIEVKTAEWIASYLKKHKGILCQAIDVHAPTQLQLRTRFPHGFSFRNEDIRSLTHHISPKVAEGDIVLFQTTSEHQAHARHVIDVTAKAYMQ